MSQHDKAYYKAYREKNREHINSVHKAWREKNLLWYRVYHRLWYHRTKGRRNEYLRSYYRSRIDHFRKQSSDNNLKRRLEILSMLGGAKCSECGFCKDYRALQIDHVNSNGSQERKMVPHAWSYKFWKKAFLEKPQDYQILCANCNWIKRYRNRELDRCH